MAEQYPGYAGGVVNGQQNPNAFGGGFDITSLLPLLMKGGMGPAALLSFLPMLMGGAFQRHDPQEQLRQKIAELYAPANIQRGTQELYQQNLSSPGFGMGQRSILGASNQLANSVGNRMAQQYGGASGQFRMGAAPLARSTAGLNMGQLYGNTWNQSQNQYMDNINKQAQLYGGIGPSPNYTANLMAGGMNSFLPFAFRSLNPNIYRQGGG
jgi:hypothetical protein